MDKEEFSLTAKSSFSANDETDESWWDMNDLQIVSLPEKKETSPSPKRLTMKGLILETKKTYKSGYHELQSYWPNGNPKEANLKYTEGTYKTWYENGQLEISFNYKNGEKDGLFPAMAREWPT